jgi:hypothetical protein
MPGINAIRITGRLLNKNIPIGADIASASVMTRIFIINIIAAKAKVGIKDTKAPARRQRLRARVSARGPLRAMTFGPRQPLAAAVLPLVPLLPASVPQRPLPVERFARRQPLPVKGSVHQ